MTPVAGATEHDTLEDLDARAASFDDVHVHLDGVAGAESGDVAAQGGCVDDIEGLHDRYSLRPPQVGRGWIEKDEACRTAVRTGGGFP